MEVCNEKEGIVAADISIGGNQNPINFQVRSSVDCIPVAL
jgi:hypothetical protein